MTPTGFWTFQYIETAVFVGLVALVVWRIKRRACQMLCRRCESTSDRVCGEARRHPPMHPRQGGRRLASVA